MLESLNIPATARLGAHDHEPDQALAWPEVIEAARARLPSIPIANGRRQVFGIQADNGLDTLLTVFSVLQAGGLPAPFAVGTPPASVEHCLARLNAAALWNGEEWKTLGGTRRYPPGFELIMHSSGSTGIPKPLAIRLEAMQTNARDVAAALRLGQEDCHLGTMSHCYMSGLYNATLLPLFTGARSVSAPLASPANLGTLLAALERHRPTVLWLSPLIARMLVSLRSVNAECLSGIRLALSCTAPLPPKTKADFETRFGIPLLQSYGLCETLIATMEDPFAPMPGSVGRPIGPRGSVRLDADGQIVIDNHAHFAGYLDTPSLPESLAVVAPYATGDVGYFDGAGNLWVTGRLSETINRDGIKISPEIIEAALNAIPGVVDSAVVGLPTADSGDRVIAMVVAPPAMIATLHIELARCLPPVQRPHELRAVAAIPRTATGKIDRPALRRSLA